ncbi:MAG TPA: NIPSNAP family protein [Chitinophagaceae bacterium]|jgi:hypothetical protein|nr:NIPSNAP family protein [Chitinophagaceae bacterium]
MHCLFQKKYVNFFLAAVFLLPAVVAFGKEGGRDYYQIKIYHLATKAQEDRLDAYLQNAYLPAMHRAGVPGVGVFKAIDKDSEQLVYVFAPYKSWKQFEGIDAKLAADKQYQADGSDYINAPYNNIPYRRYESIILKAFKEAPAPFVPQLSAPKSERVYELRSYEGPTEKLYENKVQMFNKGNEVGLFKRLGFNAVFYAEVVSGSHMPNLMYMTTFNNKADRDKHWDAFNNDAEWKALVVKPEYQHNVSKADIKFLRPADYSDF